MSECTHNCSTCSANCGSRDKQSMYEAPHPATNVKHIIGVVSGKGGVGKSLVTTMLAVLMQRRGYRVGILDADITGPSIPKAFGLNKPVEGDQDGMVPPATTTGIEIMSVNLLLDDETRPVVWRGPVIAGTVKQFWSQTVWADLDYLFVDCPPGTGDVPLTVFQSIPLDGIVIVSSPQELVSMIVKKAANMADMMDIPVLGLVENMSYVLCPDCGKKINVFGESHIAEIANQFGYELLAQIPMDAKLAALVDKGWIEMMQNDYLDKAADKIEDKLNHK
ncbi:MAG: Mrp/NBP35 family ATP-binding protein [Clostridia bacterium]|nr:Mrp/NBP35 family ATP-binding protein [Clostridia bacterium]MBQ5361998.1 Mrp/NBP35 family ATP-binding protein [Clostridia bacterium]MBQ5792480.1 Mrp/NBP35 family ATP-binding protein [Clostridia bacterium]